MRRQLFSLVAGALGVTMMAAPAFAQDQPATNVTVNPPPAQQPAPQQPSTVIVQQPAAAPVEDHQVVVVPTPQQAAEQNETTTVTNSNVIVTGVLTFGVSYGIAAIVAAQSDNSADKRLYVPILGPWLAMSDRGSCPVEQAKCDSQTTDKILLAVDGVFQAVGVVTAVYGVLSPVSVTHSSTSAKRDVHVVPVSMGQGHSAGLGLAGSF